MPARLIEEIEMWILWTIVIGFIAGVLAKFVTPGDTHEPQGFILTTLWGSQEPSSRPTLVRLSVGIKKARLQGLLVRPWAQS